MELRWPATLQDASGAIKRPLFEIQQSADLIHWQSLGKAFRAEANAPALSQLLPRSETQYFYRLAARMDDTFVGSSGEDVFGYTEQVQEAWGQIGSIPPQEFQSRYDWPAGHYLDALHWDPARCVNWTNYMPVAGEDVAYDPAPPTFPPRAPNIVHFRLNEDEAKVLRTNGFVVSERLGSYSFPEAFNQIYMKDLPVFVATDAILQAWHRTYQDILEELEEIFLAPSMETVLGGMADGVAETWRQYGNSGLKDSIQDADFFLAVARSLQAGAPVASKLGQDDRVAAALTAIASQSSQSFVLFGEERTVDFSQFTVRGHYDHSVRLQRYFKMMMWCGRIDLRLTPVEDNLSKAESLRELGTSVVLNELLTRSGQYALWQQCDQVIEAFVGWSDSLNFTQWRSVLAGAGIQSLADLPDPAALERLQAALISGDAGVQNILSDYYVFPLGASQALLPRSFAVLGQKFVLDSWALSECVFPNVMGLENGRTNQIMRRIPSGLDVAFSVFANPDCVPELVARMLDTGGRQFRDGLPYQRQLAAVRQVIDQQASAAWDSNIYVGWLAALRGLSQSTTGAEYPDCLRTRAWAMKNLNTQLASWTHLRSATVLYAKQSYTGDFLCSYPCGFVEPRPEFFQNMRHLATLAGGLIANLPIQGTYTITNHDQPMTVDLRDQKANQVNFLGNFAAVMQTLASIATKELAQTPLSNDESVFLRNLIEVGFDCTGQRMYTGWYPGLYYRNILAPQVRTVPAGKHCDTWDALATDVHTDVRSEQAGDPGCVLHEAVGNVWMLVAAINNGADRMIYAGPVFSHYEFEQPINKRLTEAEWKAMVRDGSLPSPPTWVNSYLVPGHYAVPNFPAN